MRVVHLTGIIDYNTAPAARRNLLTELHADDLDIDLADVTRIDSSCLATLVEIFQVARRTGREVHLLHVNCNVLGMVHLAHLEGVFSLGTRGDGLNPKRAAVLLN
jgi:anti-sigma B factor antagonist